MAKKLTAKEAIDFQKYLDTLKEDDKKVLLEAVDDAANADKKAEAKEAKGRVEFYYDVKEKIENELLSKLIRMPSKSAGTEPPRLGLKTAGDNGWSTNKILKIIANLPNKKPDKDDGYILAARNIEVGKPKKISKEIREARALARKQKKERIYFWKRK